MVTVLEFASLLLLGFYQVPAFVSELAVVKAGLNRASRNHGPTVRARNTFFVAPYLHISVAVWTLEIRWCRSHELGQTGAAFRSFSQCLQVPMTLVVFLCLAGL